MPNNKIKSKQNTSITKEVIIVGDIEMGAGNLTDDFIADNALSKLIMKYSKRPNPVDLVLNGDTFDFLKCPYTLKPKPLYTPYITTQVALSKIKLINKAHPLVFRALRKFTQQKNKVIYFIRGNHDFELVFPEVQQAIKKCINVQGENIIFPGLWYDKDGVYSEHGHQYDPFNKIETIFADHKNQRILNNSFISTMIITTFLRLKEKHPFMERIKPIPTLFSVYPLIRKKMNRRLVFHMVKSMVYYPLRHFRHPLHKFPASFLKKFLREAFSRLVSGNMEPFAVIPYFKKAQPSREGIIILSHIHETNILKSPKNTIIHPNSWRDEYILNPSTKKLIPKRKRYVHITMHNNKKLRWKLRTFTTKRKLLDFNDVVKNEKEYIQKVAEEERS